MKTIQKEVKQNEDIYVLFNIIDMLYEKYRFIVSKNISLKFYELMLEIQKEYEKDYEDLDIIKCELIERITFEDIRK